MGHSDTPDHPPECDGLGGITSVSAVDATADGLAFSVVASHPLNAIDHEGDACRLAQYRQAFEELPGEGAALVAGDMNYDPYRFPDVFASGPYWHSMVGESRRYTAHSVTEDPPVPTWSEVVTLDYITSDFLAGRECVVWGESPYTEPIDGDLARADHRAVWCSFSWDADDPPHPTM